MLIIPPPAFPRKRRQIETPATGPTLVSAVYDSDGLTLLLTFDRAIDISGWQGHHIFVNDPFINIWLLQAVNPVLASESAVIMDLGIYRPATGDQILLNALPGSGIVAAAGGVGWPGIGPVPLPFP